jgi:hypothetical protein
MTNVTDPAVAEAFRAFPPAARIRLLALREMIFDEARKTDAGLPTESLKWGEPAYRPLRGSTIRLGWKEEAPKEVAMYFICTTGLVDRFRELYPDDFRFGGNRALLFDLKGPLPETALRHCIALALTYHRK